MLRLDKVIKPWKESAALNDHINLYGFSNETTFLTKSGDLGKDGIEEIEGSHRADSSPDLGKVSGCSSPYAAGSRRLGLDPESGTMSNC